MKTGTRAGRREAKRIEKDRVNALLRASNGERLPARERAELGLPDWTS